MAGTTNRTLRLSDDVWEAIEALPGRTKDEALRAHFLGNSAREPVTRASAEHVDTLRLLSEQIAEILELVQSMAAMEGYALQCHAGDAMQGNTSDPRQVLAEVEERVGVAPVDKEALMIPTGDVGGYQVPLLDSDGKAIPFPIRKQMAADMRKKKLAGQDALGSAVEREDIEYEEGAGAP